MEGFYFNPNSLYHCSKLVFYHAEIKYPGTDNLVGDLVARLSIPEWRVAQVVCACFIRIYKLSNPGELSRHEQTTAVNMIRVFVDNPMALEICTEWLQSFLDQKDTSCNLTLAFQPAELKKPTAWWGAFEGSLALLDVAESERSCAKYCADLDVVEVNDQLLPLTASRAPMWKYSVRDRHMFISTYHANYAFTGVYVKEDERVLCFYEGRMVVGLGGVQKMRNPMLLARRNITAYACLPKQDATPGSIITARGWENMVDPEQRARVYNEARNTKFGWVKTARHGYVRHQTPCDFIPVMSYDREKQAVPISSNQWLTSIGTEKTCYTDPSFLVPCQENHVMVEVQIPLGSPLLLMGGTFSPCNAAIAIVERVLDVEEVEALERGEKLKEHEEFETLRVLRDGFHNWMKPMLENSVALRVFDPEQHQKRDSWKVQQPEKKPAGTIVNLSSMNVGNDDVEISNTGLMKEMGLKRKKYKVKPESRTHRTMDAARIGEGGDGNGKRKIGKIVREDGEIDPHKLAAAIRMLWGDEQSRAFQSAQEEQLKLAQEASLKSFQEDAERKRMQESGGYGSGRGDGSGGNGGEEVVRRRKSMYELAREEEEGVLE